MNLKRNTSTQLLATVLIVCLQALFLPSSMAAAPGELTGSVFSTNPTHGLSGVVVHVARLDDGRLFSSAPTNNDGTFIVEDLPAGSYEIAIESAGVLYTVGTPVRVGDSPTRRLQLRLDDQADATQGVPSSQLQSVWNNPLTATLIVVGAVILIGVAADSTSSNDDEGPASPF